MAAWQEMPLSGSKRKKGGVIALWSLGTLWLACLAAGGDPSLKCEDLRVGQYICEDPKIDNETQEPLNCTNHTAYGLSLEFSVECQFAGKQKQVKTSVWEYPEANVACLPAPNITCKNFFGNETQFTGKEIGFYKPIECRNVNGYSYKVAVALSLFLGWLGADRFYLGYPALGLLKFCTVGFCGIGSLIDFILISMQIVGPSDGSSYIIDYYGARLTRLTISNETFRKPQIYP